MLALLVLSAGDTKLTIADAPLKIGLDRPGTAVAPHPAGSLLLGDPDRPEPASLTAESFNAHGHRVLAVRTPSGLTATVTVAITPNQVDLVVRPSTPAAVLLRFAPLSPGFGLGDHAVTARPSYDTDITGYRNDHFLSATGLTRLISNFAFYPKQEFAFLVWDPGVKVVRSTSEECLQGSRHVESEVRFSLFTGASADIYRQFLQSRNQFDYPVLKPKYEFFGVGWEAFGALAWDTNYRTVADNVNQYLSLGYPLQWMVVGSGFWPRDDKRFHETTSFGLYDPNLYPDPRAFIAQFHAKGLKFFQGLRTTFIVDGPNSEAGVRNGYFMEENGKPKVFQFDWPKSPIYFLDWRKPQAVAWFTELARKWTAFGVDGFKEDVYGYQKYSLGDDKLDPVNAALMREGAYIMGRNAYLASPADLHRLNDFNFNQNQDRGPVNALAYGYSGFPLVYPDIVGGTFGEGHFDLKVTPRMRQYMKRNAMWAALHPSMSMGQGPWTFGDQQLEQVLLQAARLHDRLQPYFYSQAVRFSNDGYPWPFAPLPVAFPHEDGVYGRENDRQRGYQWMIGDALLAAPLYGNDYETASTRDVYLPRGQWMEYDSGKRHQGPTLLKNYALPVDQTPLFVGGSGIVVEKSPQGLVARVYPVASTAGTRFTHPDGLAISNIRVHVTDWQRAALQCSSVRPCAGRWQRHAFEFPIRPGEDYDIR
jgi:alpha-glucosidase (family GH31 glycosyl hydrolase)